MSECVCQGASFTTCDSQARRQWMMATVGVGGALGLTALTPFVSSLMPSERAKAAGAPVEVDIGKLAPGDLIKILGMDEAGPEGGAPRDFVIRLVED